MTRALTYLFVLMLGLVLAAGPASSVARADHGAPYRSATLTRYLQVAQAQWGRPAPACPGRGNSVVGVHAVLFDSPDPEVSAVAEMPGCRIWLDRDFWPAPNDAIDCTIIAHEWGHLLGYGHSEIPQSLMYATPELGAPGCGVFGQAVVALVAHRPKHRVRRGKAVRGKASPRRCAGTSGAARGQPRGKCRRSTRGRSQRSR